MTDEQKFGMSIFTVMMGAMILVLLLFGYAHATWKPEYGKEPVEIQSWYINAELTKAAQDRFPFKKCCERADRFKTKFVPGNGFDAWSYYTDPACTHGGCPIAPIPDDIIHEDPIPHSRDPATEAVYDQMRTEGVLFIYIGQPTCFWPPEGGG